MSLLQAYLQKPSTQRALSRKPGDKGFSLIELVVVVAVLAILAAIAIPQFSQLSDDARLNSTKSIIANMYKECEFNKARTGQGFHTIGVNGTPNGVDWSSDATVAATDGTGCDGPAFATMPNNTCHIAMDLSTGQQYWEVTTSSAATPVSIPATIPAGQEAWPANMEDCT